MLLFDQINESESESEICIFSDPALFDPCLAKPCDHGSCVQQDLSYFCSCDEGFTGPDCSVKTTSKKTLLYYPDMFKGTYFEVTRI